MVNKGENRREKWKGEKGPRTDRWELGVIGKWLPVMKLDGRMSVLL